MMPALQKAMRPLSGLAVGVALLALPGCGGIDGVDLNGKVFDAVGLTGSLTKKAEPTTEVRAPLVMPPSSQRLPEPGENGDAAPVQTAEAWPNDPDKQRVASEAAKKQAQADYCRDGNWKEKAMSNDRDGPNGSCGSIFSAISKAIVGE